jgi:hypothetical protein
MITRIQTIAELAERLKADDVAHEVGEGQVWLPVAEGDLRTTAMILWPADLALVQIVVPLPFQPEPALLPALHEALARLNHALIVPGFGFDHGHQQPYYRLVEPRALDGGMDVQALQRTLSTAVRTAARFGGLLAAVGAGEMAPAAVTEGLA